MSRRCWRAGATGGATRNQIRCKLKRAMGFEPTTSSLGSWHSTAELRPQISTSSDQRLAQRGRRSLARATKAFRPSGSRRPIRSLPDVRTKRKGVSSPIKTSQRFLVKAELVVNGTIISINRAPIRVSPPSSGTDEPRRCAVWILSESVRPFDVTAIAESRVVRYDSLEGWFTSRVGGSDRCPPHRPTAEAPWRGS